MNEQLLRLLIALPLLAACAVALLPASRVVLVRAVAVLALLLEAGLSLALLTGDFSSAGYRFVSRLPLGGGVGLSLGVDGISLWPVILVACLAPALVGAQRDATQGRALLMRVLWAQGCVIGALCSFDLLLFALFFVLSLGALWNAPARGEVVRGRFLLDGAGVLALMAGITTLASEYRQETGQWQFDLVELGQLLLPVETQRGLFLLFAFPFLVRLPVAPLHGASTRWAAQRDGTVGALSLLVGPLLGFYGLARIAMGLFPAGSHRAGVTLAAVAVVGIAYAGLVALGSRESRSLPTLAALAGSGVVVLGLFSITSMGVEGALLLMLSLCAGLALSWAALERGARPAVVAVGLLVACGLPPFGGFAGQLLVLGGALRAEHLGANGTPLSCFAVLGMVLLAARAARLRGEGSSVANDVGDAAPGPVARAQLVWLGVLALGLGLLSARVLEPVEPAADHFARVYTAKLKASDAHPEERGLLERAP